MCLVPSPVAVDLFCGAGGLAYGMQRAGVGIAAGIDIDPACRYPFEANVAAPFHERDIAGVGPDELASLYPGDRVRVLAGCAPCQPFSSYTRTKGGDHDEWRLLPRFAELAVEARPEIVTMENVPRLRKHPVFKEFLDALGGAGYHCGAGRVVQCAEYGVPQTRRRLVLLASLLGPIDLVRPEGGAGRPATVRETIGRLEAIPAGGSSGSDPLHKASRLSDRNMERIRQSAPGGTWRDWGNGLRAACHARETGKTYPGVYGRMEWDRPGPTITTQFHGYGTGRFGHPEQDRALSLREGAMLQTFPEGYRFAPDGDPVRFRMIARMIGNAVPVRLGEAIGQSIIRHLEGIGR